MGRAHHLGYGAGLPMESEQLTFPLWWLWGRYFRQAELVNLQRRACKIWRMLDGWLNAAVASFKYLNLVRESLFNIIIVIVGVYVLFETLDIGLLQRLNFVSSLDLILQSGQYKTRYLCVELVFNRSMLSFLSTNERVANRFLGSNGWWVYIIHRLAIFIMPLFLLLWSYVHSVSLSQTGVTY